MNKVDPSLLRDCINAKKAERLVLPIGGDFLSFMQGTNGGTTIVMVVNMNVKDPQ